MIFLRNKLFFSLLCFILLCGCSKSFSIESPAKVTIQHEEDVIEITDNDTISRLTEQITSITFERGESSQGQAGWDYRVIWYDESGEPIFDAYVSPTSIDYQGRFWICENGTIDVSYYDELLYE